MFGFPDESGQFCHTNRAFMKENEKDKFLRICSMIGELERPGEDSQLAAELNNMSTKSENMFYAAFGMSAEEILSVIH